MFMNHRLKGYLSRSQELFFNTQSKGIRTTQKAIQRCQGCHSHHRPSVQRPGGGAVSKGEATSPVQAGQDASFQCLSCGAPPASWSAGCAQWSLRAGPPGSQPKSGRAMEGRWCPCGFGGRSVEQKRLILQAYC